MNALNSILGRPGEPIECRTIGEASIHWWHEPTQVGDWCLCGETQKRLENPHFPIAVHHCTCWQNDEKPCCGCDYDGDDDIDCVRESA